MSLRAYVYFWLLLLFVCSFESWMLNFHPEQGILGMLKRQGYFPHLSLNPETGKSISLFLGWTGFAIMCGTNIYTFRKRLFSHRLSKISGWLDFHILCGLVGPTLILFHTNFKVGGLVAVSFWSMVISFTSGIVGRYFYLQVTGQKSELESLAAGYEKNLNMHTVKVPKETLAMIRMQAFQLGCVPAEDAHPGVAASLFLSLKGDLQMRMSYAGLAQDLNDGAQNYLQDLVYVTRKRILLEQFRKLMGYWHSFHMPFAVFMYVVAIIHIVTATLLGVGEVL
ncbi:MAG TPA: hypothetical protein VIH99_00140 [Bdellovibrionota bacterium]|jgi:hypothetical protein